MGCNQSTEADIKNSKNDTRSKAQPTSNQQPGQSSQTPSKQIGVPAKDSEDGQPQEFSYSKLRELDNDYFKDIIDRTAQKFIDVSMTGSDGGKDAYIGRDKDYSAQIKDTKITKPATLTGLPHLSQACQVSNLHNLLSQPVPFDNELMSNYTNSILNSLNNIAVKDCGELVVFFGNSLKN
ncbi:hypothetical protein DLAC_05279 [Tieghemostelium lacteum]|uniref:Uncharacterized protein n=1 Tax=Tieghemostelium lacteum TaxID=361077 RepID=A0A151ZIQ1_TIELA|nr:hypothetical protein DLAC_05279 [Tieghemostelium lacteum]|eukprot:KYQ93878.1 hypothetical protein DLAC_05279 [Tieghemostelium lacteum]